MPRGSFSATCPREGRRSIDVGPRARSSAGAIFQADGITPPLTRYGDHGRPFLAFRRRAYFLDSQASGRIAGAILILLLLDALSFGLPFNQDYSRLPPSRQWPCSGTARRCGAFRMVLRSKETSEVLDQNTLRQGNPNFLHLWDMIDGVHLLDVFGL